jgi:MFS superfamily sulfate permease-like transporter
MVATLLVPIHVAVLIGVLLSLLLVGITSSTGNRVVALERANGGWRRAELPGALPPGEVTVLDIEGAGAFASVPGLFARLPRPAAAGVGTAGGGSAVVLRLRGHLRTNLTFTKALESYEADLAEAGGLLIICGLQPETITQLRSAGLPESVELVAQGEVLEASLVRAYERATAWLAGTRTVGQPGPEPSAQQP